jgi:hypothetical protein
MNFQATLKRSLFFARDKIINMQQQNKPRHANKRSFATNPSLALVLAKPPKARQQRQMKPRPKRKGPSPQRRDPVQMQHAKVSECSLMYASALFDPENTSEGACVPYGFPTPSMKQKVFTRGTFQLGTTGQGYIAYLPNVTNDGTAVITTTSASVGTAATTLTAFTGQTNTTLSKLMFSTADVVTGTNVAARIVAGGIKVRYAGTEANRNGTMTALEEPNHRNLLTRTGSEIRGYVNSFVERPDPLGSFYTVNLSGPVTSLETQFQNLAAPWSCPVAIFIDGLAGDKYEFEVYQHVEYVGVNVPGVSASHSDPVAYAKVIETAKAITVSEPLSDKNAPGGFRRFIESVGSTIKQVAKSHGPDIIGMISNALLPGSGILTSGLLRANQRLALKG